MHPIERLRYVARAGSVPDPVLVAESVPALTAFARNPGGLLVALRRLIMRQPDSPGLLVLGARMLTGLDPSAEAWGLVDAMDDDTTAAEADELVEQQGRHIELVECIASGPSEVLVPPGSTRWIEQAQAANKTVVGLTPLGTRLPRLLWKGYLDRSTRDEPFMASNEVLDADLIDRFIGPGQAGAGWSSDCSDVAELASF